jgi:hypothetical protein
MKGKGVMKDILNVLYNMRAYIDQSFWCNAISTTSKLREGMQGLGNFPFKWVRKGKLWQ